MWPGRTIPFSYAKTAIWTRSRRSSLAQHTGHVALDRGLAEVELGRDLGVRRALGDGPDHVQFPFAEVTSGRITRGAGRRPAAEVLDQAPGDGRREQCLACRHGLHGYEPASRFWALQWVETRIFLALALALAGYCLCWLIRRIA
jgi:hypothetical protein